MGEKVRIWIGRIILLAVCLYSGFIIYNTKIKSVRIQEENQKQLESIIASKNMAGQDEDEDSQENSSSLSVAESQLNLIGMLRVPKISLNIAIYDSTEEDALRAGTGLLEGTGALPPKENQNIIITTHNGDDKQDLFMNLNKLELGDEFHIKDTSGQDNSYKVSNIQTVEPTEIFKSLKTKKTPQVTLLTCTPTGINSHRLLVTGELVNEQNGPVITSTQTTEEKGIMSGITFSTYEIIVIVIGAISFVLLILSFLNRKEEMEDFSESDDEIWGID